MQLEDEGVYVHPELVEICREMGGVGLLSLLMPRETDTRAGWIRSSGNNAWDLSNGRFLTGKGVRRATNQKSAQRDRDGR